MLINRIFLGFMVVVGIAAGLVLVAYPESRDFKVMPYLWILIAVAAFEISTYAYKRGAPGTMISTEARLLGFVIGIVLMIVIPIFAGSPGRLF
jgi:hypothetical protein